VEAKAFGPFIALGPCSVAIPAGGAQWATLFQTAL